MLKTIEATQVKGHLPHFLGQTRNVPSPVGSWWVNGAQLSNERSSSDSWRKVAAKPRLESFKEFDRVKLLARIKRGGHIVSPGSIGVVVYIHGNGGALEVEFSDPECDVVTLKPSDLKRLND